MIETIQIDIQRPVNQTKEIIHFTNANDLRWTGLINLPPGESLLLTRNTRHAFYILQGELIDTGGSNNTRDTFLRHGANSCSWRVPAEKNYLCIRTIMLQTVVRWQSNLISLT